MADKGSLSHGFVRSPFQKAAHMAKGDSSSAYIPHLDGLRAIAIIVVLLYHFEVKVFCGGFVGVDVFFVLSGFLITRRIRSAVASESGFSLTKFYKARFWRLYPTSLVTVLSTTIVASYLFPPHLQEKTFFSSLATLTMTSNVLFSREVGGYFDEGAVSKPLLHTWSLSLEEQFYLIWPLLMVLVTKKAANELPAVNSEAETSKRCQPVLSLFSIVLCIIMTTSFVASLYCSRVFPRFSWFHLLTRAHEFGFGAVAVVLYPKGSSLPHFHATVLSAVGLIMIISSCIFLGGDVSEGQKSADFPGWASLPSLIGSVMVVITPQSLYSGIHGLSSRPMRYIGKISYSLYLAHWPIWVFLVYFKARRDLSKEAILCTVVLGIVLHYSCEEPLRLPSRGRCWILITLLFATAAALVQLLGLSNSVEVVEQSCERPINHLGKPIVERETKEFQTIDVSLADANWTISPSLWNTTLRPTYVTHGTSQELSPPRLVVVGDSYAEVCQSIASVIEEGYVMCIKNGGCWVSLHDEERTSPGCESDIENLRVAMLSLPRSTKIMVALRWEDKGIASHHRVMDWFLQNDFKDITMIGSHPHLMDTNSLDCLQRARLDNSIVCPEHGPADEAFVLKNDLVKSVASEKLLPFVDFVPHLCSGSNESGGKITDKCYTIVCGAHLYSDLKGHFSLRGRQFAVNAIEPFV